MRVALFGGTGFIGSYLIDELIANNYDLKVLVRKGSERKIDSKVELVFGDINNDNSIINTIKGTDIIIYNIGIIREIVSKNITYKNLHYEGLKDCIFQAKKNGVKRFILMSANGVKPNGTGYQQTKWDAEELLKKSELDWTIFRPSLVFGDPKDDNRPEFCKQLRDDMLSLPFPAPLFYKGLFPIDAGSFCMSPIHVKNVAEFFVKSIQKLESISKVYILGGTSTLSWKEIINEIAIASGKRTWKIPAPVVIVKFIAKLLDKFQWFPVTGDQLDMLMEGNIVTEYYFNDFNIKEIPFKKENLKYLKR